MRTSIGAALASLLLVVGCDGDSKPSSGDASPEAGGAAKGDEGGGPKGAFGAYQAKSMASEAKVNLAGIATGARILFEEERMDPGSMTVSTGTLPPSIPMTPPAGTCCKQPGGTCAPDLGEWSHEGWKELGFAPSTAHRYSYEVAVEGQTVTVRAVGDLDCDGTFSTYESVGKVEGGALEFAPKLRETDPLE